MLCYIMVFIILFSSEVSYKTFWERYKSQALNVSEKRSIFIRASYKMFLSKKKKVIS